MSDVITIIGLEIFSIGPRIHVPELLENLTVLMSSVWNIPGKDLAWHGLGQIPILEHIIVLEQWKH